MRRFAARQQRRTFVLGEEIERVKAYGCQSVWDELDGEIGASLEDLEVRERDEVSPDPANGIKWFASIDRAK